VSSPGPKLLRPHKKTRRDFLCCLRHEIYVFPSQSAALNLNDDKNSSNISDMGSRGINGSLSQALSSECVSGGGSLEVDKNPSRLRFPPKLLVKFASQRKSSMCLLFAFLASHPSKGQFLCS
jgi:hypothetical protein